MAIIISKSVTAPTSPHATGTSPGPMKAGITSPSSSTETPTPWTCTLTASSTTAAAQGTSRDSAASHQQQPSASTVGQTADTMNSPSPPPYEAPGGYTPVTPTKTTLPRFTPWGQNKHPFQHPPSWDPPGGFSTSSTSSAPP